MRPTTRPSKGRPIDQALERAQRCVGDVLDDEAALVGALHLSGGKPLILLVGAQGVALSQ
jgi:hypothetical protein